MLKSNRNIHKVHKSYIKTYKWYKIYFCTTEEKAQSQKQGLKHGTVMHPEQALVPTSEWDCAEIRAIDETQGREHCRVRA